MGGGDHQHRVIRAVVQPPSEEIVVGNRLMGWGGTGAQVMQDDFTAARRRDGRHPAQGIVGDRGGAAGRCHRVELVKT